MTLLRQTAARMTFDHIYSVAPMMVCIESRLGNGRHYCLFCWFVRHAQVLLRAKPRITVSFSPVAGVDRRSLPPNGALAQPEDRSIY
jgi:hypothetical protein